MLKSKLLLLTVIASITLVSCKKESLIADSVMPSPSDVRVKTKTEGNNVETYYYDNQNRLSKIVFSSNSTSYYYEYTYSNGTVAEYRSNEPRYEKEQTLPNGAVRMNCTSNPRLLQLDAGGFYKGSSSTCEVQSYKYDAKGFVVEQNLTITDFNRADQIVNDSKNITKINGKGYSYGNGAFTTVTTLVYYNDKRNTIGNINFGKVFFGKSSENLVKSEIEGTNTTNYTYAFDAQQRVVTKIQTKGSVETLVTYTYY